MQCCFAGEFIGLIEYKHKCGFPSEMKTILNVRAFVFVLFSVSVSHIIAAFLLCMFA